MRLEFCGSTATSKARPIGTPRPCAAQVSPPSNERNRPASVAAYTAGPAAPSAFTRLVAGRALVVQVAPLLREMRKPSSAATARTSGDAAIELAAKLAVIGSQVAPESFDRKTPRSVAANSIPPVMARSDTSAFIGLADIPLRPASF